MNSLCKAIIFNPNQELELIKKQKQIIKKILEKKQVVFPKYPVFCFLQNPIWKSFSLKEIKNLIKTVTFEEIYIENSSVKQKIKITTRNKDKIEEFVEVATLKIQNESLNNLFFENSKTENCKIFKLAQVEYNEYSWEILNCIWCKI